MDNATVKKILGEAKEGLLFSRRLAIDKAIGAIDEVESLTAQLAAAREECERLRDAERIAWAMQQSFVGHSGGPVCIKLVNGSFFALFHHGGMVDLDARIGDAMFLPSSARSIIDAAMSPKADGEDAS